MANKEQFELLKAGVEGWSKWGSQDKWKTKINLARANLERADSGWQII